MIVLRWRYRRWLKHKRADGHYLQTVVLVGTNEDAAAMWQMLSDEPELGYRVGGVVGKEAQEARWQGLPHRSALADLPQLADEVGAEGVILVSSAVTSAESTVAVRDSLACGLHVQFWPGLAGVLSSRIRTAPVCGLPMFYVEAHKPPAWHHAAKRAIDIVTAAILLPLSAPVLLAAAIAIRLEDGGPVLYRHPVIGRYGVQTNVLKLRTMVPNAAKMTDDLAAMNERKGGPLFKASNDPRVTRIGRILRVDEHRRAPSALGCPDRPDEPGRTAVRHAQGSRPVRRGVAAADRHATRDNRLVANRSQGQPVLQRVPAAGPALRRQLVPRPGPGHTREHGSLRERPGGEGPAPARRSIAGKGSLPRRPTFAHRNTGSRSLLKSKDEGERF